MKLSDRSENRIVRCLFWLFILLGILARVRQFGSLPADINQDEAFAGYTAYSLLKYGIDTSGYRFPVYLTAWGSGMNALNSYLMIPFIAVYGLKAWVIRLPQLIIAVLSLPVMYNLVKRISGKRCAIIALCILSLCPWHIMLSRWGLESNLAPGFILFGLYFFIKATDDERFLPLSALMYGLSLYTYATIWPFVPLMLLLMGIYAFRRHRLHFDLIFFASVAILFFFALPLLLFLLVNYDVIPEIRLPFLSIPRLLYMRSNEISVSSIKDNLINLLKILVFQTDRLPWNSTSYGLIYLFTLPFSVIGIIRFVTESIRAGKDFDYSVPVLIHLGAAILLGCLINVNVNRVNIIFIPLIICAAAGFDLFCSKLHAGVFPACIAAYIIAFMCFSSFYFSDYQHRIAPYFAEGLERSVALVDDFDGTVYVSDYIYYPSLLFYDKTDVNVFFETVEYRSYPAAFLRPNSFGKYIFIGNEIEPIPGCAYILPAYSDISAFSELGFSAEFCGTFVVLK